MRAIDKVRLRLRTLLRRDQVEHELDSELQFHLDRQIEENVAAGMLPGEARLAALRTFGGIAQLQEECREMRRLSVLESLAQDLRHGIRAMRRSPGFAVTSIAVLALAIGVNAAMFSLLETVLLRPLPFPEPQQLVVLWSEIPSQAVREGRSAYRNIEEWKRQSSSFEDLAFYDPASAVLTLAEGSEKISLTRASANLFELLGMRPLVGRTFSAREAEDGQRVAIISEKLWISRFGRSQDVIGKTIDLNERPSQIIGVMPETPAFFSADVWEPHTLSPDWDALRSERGAGPWFVLGRLKRNVSLPQAQDEMNRIARALDEQWPSAAGPRGISLVSLADQLIGAKPRLALEMLTGAVFLMLLIAAANVAGLSLARNARRAREFSVRAALGATTGRVARQLLAESLLVAALAGALSILVARACIALIYSFGPEGIPRLGEVRLQPSALALALVLCVLALVAVGLAPAVKMARREFAPAEGSLASRGVAGGAAASVVRKALVVTEIALSMVLLFGAGLLVRSLQSVGNVRLGFDPEGLLSIPLMCPGSWTLPQRAAFHARVIEEVRALPAVGSAGIISNLFVGGVAEQPVTAEGQDSRNVRFRSDEVSADLFGTMRSPLLRGRKFTNADGAGPAPVVIVNDVMARTLWPDGDAIGKRFKIGSAGSVSPWRTVVGVVADMRRQGIEQEPFAQAFEPLAQNPPRMAILMVRASANPQSILASAREAVHRVSKNAPVYGATTLEQQLGSFSRLRRLQTSLLSLFASAGLLLAAIGIYGLLQYSVTARTQEIGVRVALGARGADVLWLVIGEGLRLSLLGAVLGLGGSLLLAKAGSSLLYGVAATDPVAIAGVAGLLIAVTSVACYLPARRATKIAPTVALRQ